MDFLKNLSISDSDHRKHETEAPPSTAKEGLLNKISDVLNAVDHKTTQTVAPTPAAPPTKEEHLFHKLSDVLKGKETVQAPPPPPPEPEGLFDKIGSALGHHGKQHAQPPPKQPDLLSMISDTITGKKEEPPKPQTLVGKLNSALGGGAGSEAKEGKLDKAIDLFQEHILKEGPQNNESIFEQAKDKQIANAIRKTFGIEKEKHRN